MKTRYSAFTMLLLFCSTLMAQSQKRIAIVTPSDSKTGTSFFKNDDFTLLSGSDKHIFINRDRNPCKVFIGVGTIRHAETGGLKVDYTVDNTPATTYGVKAGDVILSLDGVAVRTQSELETERDKHQQGDAFSLRILRDGREMTIDARFKECSEEELEQTLENELNREQRMERHRDFMHMMPRLEGMSQKFEFTERPILGIYKDEEVEGAAGVVIKEVISGKGAEAAGLRVGDIITVVDGRSLAEGSLPLALTGHKKGDQVTVVYMRNGQTMETQVTLSADRNVMHSMTERDPCKVFIGVYTSDFTSEGKEGVRVSGVIDGTPAKISEVQPGDVIIALDGQPVNTNVELRIERDKHQPGDPFRLTVLRDGSTVDIQATFKSCPKSETTLITVPETVELTPDAVQIKTETSNPESTLQLEVLDVFPNPTLGPLNIRFEAQAIPTDVRITDAAGKTVYSNELNQFNGFFNEQINLDGKSPGIYTITIQQDKKVFSKKFVLMSRV